MKMFKLGQLGIRNCKREMIKNKGPTFNSILVKAGVDVVSFIKYDFPKPLGEGVGLT